jgi:hypothetical protein
MKKHFVVLAIFCISMWGVWEVSSALSIQRMATIEDICKRATEECPERPGYYMVVCKNGGAGYVCTYPAKCPYVLNATDCEEPPPAR